MIIKSTFLKNVLVLFRGNVLFQVIVILTLMFLTQHYSIEKIGRYAVFISIISILSTVAPGRLEMAIMLPKKESEAHHVFIASILSILSICLLFVLISFLLYALNIFFKVGELKTLVLLFFGILLVALCSLQTQYLNRHEKFGHVSNGKTIAAIIICFIQVASIYYFASVFGLVLGYVLGFLSCAIYYQLKLLPHFKNKTTSFNKVKTVFRIYKKFPTINNLSSLLNILANQGPVIVLEIVFGSAISGFYSVMQKTLNAPVSLIGAAFSQVFYKKVASEGASLNLKKFMLKTTKGLLILSLVILCAVFILSDFMYVLIFGKEYIVSAAMAKIMVFFFITRLMFVSQNALLVARNKLVLDLKFNFMFVIAIISPIILASIFNWSWSSCLTVMAIFGTVVFLYLGYILLKKIE